jgi:hypothetical protein
MQLSQATLRCSGKGCNARGLTCWVRFLGVAYSWISCGNEREHSKPCVVALSEPPYTGTIVQAHSDGSHVSQEADHTASYRVFSCLPTRSQAVKICKPEPSKKPHYACPCDRFSGTPGFQLSWACTKAPVQGDCTQFFPLRLAMGRSQTHNTQFPLLRITGATHTPLFGVVCGCHQGKIH